LVLGICKYMHALRPVREKAALAVNGKLAAIEEQPASG